ncbi:MAG TPA: GDSL-type esterase/lipase family protein [Solimonas sp.]|nr:GDSL-type esterase/lipase family protein [Solimonas sp.]
MHGDTLASDEAARSDWAGLAHYRDANAARAGRAPKAVFIGDSITELWPVHDPQLFGDDVIGRGISGQTSPQILLRFMADVIRLQPVVVHLLAGINDLAGNTGPFSLAGYQDNMTAMIVLARAHGLRVIVGSITPAREFPWRRSDDPRSRIAAINAWLATLAAERGCVFADYHGALAAADGALRADCTDDGVHPTAAGYARMRPIARRALRAAFAGR